jgi:hypothetical protein
MKVGHSRMKRTINLSSAQALFAQDRESITEAFPGDVIGTCECANRTADLQQAPQGTCHYFAPGRDRSTVSISIC